MKAVVRSLRIVPVVRFAATLIVSVFSGQSAVGEMLTIPGSGNPEFVLSELATAFNARQSEHRVVVPPSSGHAGAIRDVSDGVAAMGRVGRPLSSDGEVYFLRSACRRICGKNKQLA